MLVFDLIESEAVPAKNNIYTIQCFLQQQVRFLYIQGIKHDKQSVVYTKQSVVLSAAAKNTFISKILTDHTVSDKDIQ